MNEQLQEEIAALRAFIEEQQGDLEVQRLLRARGNKLALPDASVAALQRSLDEAIWDLCKKAQVLLKDAGYELLFSSMSDDAGEAYGMRYMGQDGQLDVVWLNTSTVHDIIDHLNARAAKRFEIAVNLTTASHDVLNLELARMHKMRDPDEDQYSQHVAQWHGFMQEIEDAIQARRVQ